MVGECSVPRAVEQAQDEGVLRDVLNELEKERVRRAELENKIHQMDKNDITTENQSNHSTAPHDHGIDDIDHVHGINLMLAEYISKINGITEPQHHSEHLSPLLIQLFKEFFDATVNICQHTPKTVKFESIEKKVVNQAVSQVMLDYTKHASKRFSLKENAEVVLCPILNVTVTDFISTLKQIANDEGYLSSKCTLEKTQADQNSENEMRLKILSLRTENCGLLDVIDALTTTNNAITLASQNCLDTLPIHTVRCLEIMPWDAQQHASIFEEVHEWQTYDYLMRRWTSKLKAFPPCLADLPTHDNENISNQLSETDSYQLSNSKGIKRLQSVVDSFSLSGSLFTDATCSNILDLRNGYPLPTRGEWEWVGGWKLGDEPESNDDEGWSYTEEVKDHMTEARLQCYNSDKSSTDKSPSRCFRRRTSRRQRVLISYPGISQRTKQMLSMHAQNAKLTLCVSKQNDQVLSIQHQLLLKEAEVDETSTKLNSELSSAKCEIEERNQKIKEMGRESKENISIFNKSGTPSKLNLLGSKPFGKKSVSSLLVDAVKIKRNTEKNAASDHSPNTKPAISLYESIINSKEYYENMVAISSPKPLQSTEKHIENLVGEEATAVHSDVTEGSLGLEEDTNTISGTSANWIVESVRSKAETISKNARILKQTSVHSKLTEGSLGLVDDANIISGKNPNWIESVRYKAEVISKNATNARILDEEAEANTISGKNANWIVESVRNKAETISKNARILQQSSVHSEVTEGSLELDKDANTISGKNANWIESVRNNVETISKNSFYKDFKSTPV